MLSLPPQYASESRGHMTHSAGSRPLQCPACDGHDNRRVHFSDVVSGGDEEHIVGCEPGKLMHKVAKQITHRRQVIVVSFCHLHGKSTLVITPSLESK